MRNILPNLCDMCFHYPYGYFYFYFYFLRAFYGLGLGWCVRVFYVNGSCYDFRWTYFFFCFAYCDSCFYFLNELGYPY